MDVENQHRKIMGYRELNEVEIALMNEVKEQGLALESLVRRIRDYGSQPGDDLTVKIDQRWASIGATHLQQGLMALTRAVAKPAFF